MSNTIREELRRRLNAPQPPPLDRTRYFVGGFLHDACDLDEVRESLRETAQVGHRGLLRDLQGLEGLIANPPTEEGVLAWLIASDANWVLDDLTDAGALAFLKQLAEMVREALGPAAPPPPGPTGAEPHGG